MEVLNQAVGFLAENKLISSALLILLIVLVRRIVISLIRGDVNFLTEDQRKWISRTKNSAFSVIIITLFLFTYVLSSI